MAPELFPTADPPVVPEKASDVWSFSLTALEVRHTCTSYHQSLTPFQIFTGHGPFRYIGKRSPLAARTLGALPTPEVYPNVEELVWSALQPGLQLDASRRLSMDEFCSSLIEARVRPLSSWAETLPRLTRTKGKWVFLSFFAMVLSLWWMLCLPGYRDRARYGTSLPLFPYAIILLPVYDGVYGKFSIR